MKAFELAERLGMTVRELSERMDASELMEWIAFDRCFQRPEDVRAAMMCVVVNNTWGGKARLDDFLPERERAETPDDPEEWRRTMAVMGRAIARQ